jgi:hypothetical protein
MDRSTSWVGRAVGRGAFAGPERPGARYEAFSATLDLASQAATYGNPLLPVEQKAIDGLVTAVAR